MGGGRSRLLAGGEREGAGLGADVDQTLAGLEAGQRLRAGQRGQRAAQAQHGRGVVFSCTHRGRVRTHRDAAHFILHAAHSGGGGGAHELASIALLYDGTCAGAAPSQRHSGTNRFRTLQLFTAAQRVEHDSFKGPIVYPPSHLCFSSRTQLKIQKTP